MPRVAGWGLVALALGLVACTHAGSPRSPVSPSASPTPTPSPSRPPAFDAQRVYDEDLRLTAIGPRDDATAGFARAADEVAATFSSYGYTVRRQRFAVPAGRYAGATLASGVSQNVIADPPGFDPSAPHLVVGGHLDTVAVSPGANDNGSGSAMVLELARLARSAPTALPIEWVAWGGEERRLPGPGGALFGSRFFVAHLGAAERAALRGALSVDMVGSGPKVLVCSQGVTPPAFVDSLLASAARLGIPAERCTLSVLFSDQKPFEDAGFTVALLWSGTNSTMHTSRDTMAVVDLAELDRVGRVAWETLRTLRL